MRSPPLGIASALLLLGGAAAAAPAAAHKGARLAWARGAGAERCVGLLGLEEDVKARLGYDPGSLPSELRIEGVIVSQGLGFRAELVVRDDAGKTLGTRQLASPEPDCRALGEAVAVAITVAIDPEVGGARTAGLDEAPVEIVKSPPEPCPPPPVAIGRPGGSAAITVGASAGLVPDLAPVTALRARVALGDAWEVGLGAHFWPESQSAGLGFALASAAAEACALPLAAARFARFCAAVHVGLFDVFVHAPQLSPVEVGMFPWAGAEAGPSISLPIAGPLRLETGVTAIVPLARRQAFLRGQSAPAWEQSVIGGRAELGLGAAF